MGHNTIKRYNPFRITKIYCSRTLTWRTQHSYKYTASENDLSSSFEWTQFNPMKIKLRQRWPLPLWDKRSLAMMMMLAILWQWAEEVEEKFIAMSSFVISKANTTHVKCNLMSLAVGDACKRIFSLFFFCSAERVEKFAVLFSIITSY